MEEDGSYLPVCQFHDERPADERCIRCGSFVCTTCTTYRHEMPLCPTCLAGPALMRELDHEGHIQAIGLLDLAAAGAFLFAAVVLGVHGLVWPAAALCLAAAAGLALLGRFLRAYSQPAAVVQAVLSIGLVLSVVLIRDLRQVGTFLSLGFFGGFSLWALLEERGRECFTSYYREAVAASEEAPGQSVLLVLAMLLLAVEAGLRIVFR